MSAWPEGISDGLTLACSYCKIVTRFDYNVTDDLWARLVPKEYKLGVVCLSCLDELGRKAGVCVGVFLNFVQFTGTGYTVVLKPEWIHHYTPQPGQHEGKGSHELGYAREA